MKSLLPSTALVLIHFISYCQSGYEKGLIISQHDDTTLCMVPSTFSFGDKVLIKTVEGKSQTIPVSDIKYLATANFLFENLEFIQDQKAVNKLMWLRIEGKINLYAEVQVNYKVRNAKLGTTYVIKKDDITYLIDEDNFTGLTKSLMSDAPELVTKINRDEYKYVDIKELIAAYNRLYPASVSESAPVQEAIPQLHTLKDDDVGQAIPSFGNQTLTVKLINGTVYTYQHEDWDFEDHYPPISRKIQEAIKKISVIFTKAEQAPAFAGGEEAWNKYMQRFCTQHKDDLKGESAEFVIRFAVHLHGQVSDVVIESNNRHSDISLLAIKAIQESPAWIPAMQNGRNVVCYKSQSVRIGL